MKAYTFVSVSRSLLVKFSFTLCFVTGAGSEQNLTNEDMDIKKTHIFVSMGKK